ncbi:MAG: hypothetical protein J0M15_14955 [Deltaproteobacteria bacterium]|nr:hypothetical protein [Deltaproteobacteria bacterium]
MQPNTQSQNLKICNSCKRTLHLSYFGINRKSKDGFNACCKECRNYRRRKSYHGETKTDNSNILPLNENNRFILVSALDTSSSVEIPCLNISTNTNLTFKVEKLDKAYRFEISNGTQKDCDTFYTGYTDLFVDIALNLLRKRNIRLFPTDHQHLILEWQYGSANVIAAQSTYK